MDILNSMPSSKNTRFKNVLLAFSMLIASHGAMAAGFDDMTSMATTIRTGIYTFLGVVASIIVLWQCIEGAQHRKQWGDVLVTCLWVVGAAASIAFVAYLWTKGGSMSFS